MMMKKIMRELILALRIPILKKTFNIKINFLSLFFPLLKNCRNFFSPPKCKREQVLCRIKLIMQLLVECIYREK